MPFNLRATVRGALDVVVPPFALESVRTRAVAQLHARERHGARSMLSIAAIVAAFAIFAASYAAPITPGGALAALPIPAPAPRAT